MKLFTRMCQRSDGNELLARREVEGKKELRSALKKRGGTSDSQHDHAAAAFTPSPLSPHKLLVLIDIQSILTVIDTRDRARPYEALHNQRLLNLISQIYATAKAQHLSTDQLVFMPLYRENLTERSDRKSKYGSTYSKMLPISSFDGDNRYFDINELLQWAFKELHPKASEDEDDEELIHELKQQWQHPIIYQEEKWQSFDELYSEDEALQSQSESVSPPPPNGFANLLSATTGIPTSQTILLSANTSLREKLTRLGIQSFDAAETQPSKSLNEMGFSKTLAFIDAEHIVDLDASLSTGKIVIRADAKYILYQITSEFHNICFEIFSSKACETQLPQLAERTCSALRQQNYISSQPCYYTNGVENHAGWFSENNCFGLNESKGTHCIHIGDRSTLEQMPFTALEANYHTLVKPEQPQPSFETTRQFSKLLKAIPPTGRDSALGASLENLSKSKETRTIHFSELSEQGHRDVDERAYHSTRGHHHVTLFKSPKKAWETGDIIDRADQQPKKKALDLFWQHRLIKEIPKQITTFKPPPKPWRHWEAEDLIGLAERRKALRAVTYAQPWEAATPKTHLFNAKFEPQYTLDAAPETEPFAEADEGYDFKAIQDAMEMEMEMEDELPFAMDIPLADKDSIFNPGPAEDRLKTTALTGSSALWQQPPERSTPDRISRDLAIIY